MPLPGSKSVTNRALVLAALASRAETPVEIVATDYYPSVLANLAQNVRANFPSTSSGFSTAPIITTAPLDWAAFPRAPHAQRPGALQAPFDVVFGEDREPIGWSDADTDSVADSPAVTYTRRHREGSP